MTASWRPSGSKVIAIITGGLVLASLVSSCAQTVQPEPNVIQRMSGETVAPPPPSGFLGNDYSKLQPGKEGEAALVYVNPDVQWSKYHAMMIEPVEFWDNADSSVSPADQHMLTAYTYNKFKESLQKQFTIVDQPGPGVATLQMALVNASAATPVLRSVSVVIPQARILNGIQSLATGSYAFVGGAAGELKLTDSQTGQLLAAFSDRRQGGMALKSAAQWRWGDAEAVINYWAEKANTRLASLRNQSTASN